MSSSWRHCILATALGAALMLNGGYAHADDHGFSSLATNACADDSKSETAAVASPDGKKSITIKISHEGNLELALQEGDAAYTLPSFNWSCPEILWAPDSKAFFLNYSDGGAVGNFHVVVFRLNEEGFTSYEPTQAAKADFLKNYPTCFRPEEPNMAGIAWQENSHRLLISAEVLPHSNCDMMGTFSAYVVDADSGKVLAKHGQLDAKKRFRPLLGAELQNSNDECFLVPEACSIPDLHHGAK